MRCRKENRPGLAIGDVVIIKGEERNRNFWRLGTATELFKGKDRIVHAAKIRCGKSELERAVQHLYPTELHCDWKYNDCIKNNELNEDDQIQEPRNLTELQQPSQNLKFEIRLKKNKVYLQSIRT